MIIMFQRGVFLMKKYVLVFTLLAVCLILAGCITGKAVSTSTTVKECNDLVDNDGDGKYDLEDKGCTSKYDYDESNCGDNICEGKEKCLTCAADCGVCKGNLFINSSIRGAQVFVNNELKGEVPVTLRELTVGKYAVRIEKEGYKVYSYNKTVSHNRTTKINTKLSIAQYANAICTDSDDGASYNLQGYVSLNVHNAKFQDYCEGKYVIEYYCSSGKILSKKYVCPGGCVEGKCIASLSTGSLYAVSAPTGAFVFLDGVSKGTTPLKLESVSVGSHTLKFIKDYYSPYTKSIYTYASKLTEASVTLKPIMANNTAAYCTDSDGGKIYGTRGKVSGFSTSEYGFSDFCNGSILKEYYCSGANYAVYSYACPSSTKCLEGACVQNPTTNNTLTAFCNDTDNGVDLSKKGTTSGISGDARYVYTDSCDGSYVKEYYCSGTAWKSTLMICPDNKICENGVCITVTPISACTDSDGGKNYEVLGTATAGDQAMSDHCLTDKLIMEKYCDASSIKWLNCPGICSNGACIAITPVLTCTDSDSGQNYFVLGSASAGNQTLSDHCSTNSTLTEKYCENGQIKAVSYACPYGCREGRCVQ
jgi:hypothetical protein